MWERVRQREARGEGEDEGEGKARRAQESCEIGSGVEELCRFETREILPRRGEFSGARYRARDENG